MTLKTGVMAAVFVAATGLVCGAGRAGRSARTAGIAAAGRACAATPRTAPAAEAYTYDPAGRRDPFVSLLSRGHRTDDGKETDRAVPVWRRAK